MYFLHADPVSANILGYVVGLFDQFLAQPALDVRKQSKDRQRSSKISWRRRLGFYCKFDHSRRCDYDTLVAILIFLRSVAYSVYDIDLHWVPRLRLSADPVTSIASWMFATINDRNCAGLALLVQGGAIPDGPRKCL